MILIYVLMAPVGICVLYLLFLFVCSRFADNNKEYTSDSCFYRILLNSFTGIILRLLRIKVHVTGSERVCSDRKVLFVGNHRSNYDPIITWYVFRKWKVAFVSKESNFKIPIFGRIIRKCCFMSIDRVNPKNALMTINKAADLLAHEEVSVGIYPEGTRNKSRGLLTFHNGVFKIAQKNSTPIVVIAISGTEKIAANLLRFRGSHVYLTVADIIDGQEAGQARTAQIGQRVRDSLITALDKME